MAHHFVIQGPLGAGKTFLMSLLAHYWKMKAEARGATIKLFSNYHLEEAQQMTDYTDWYDVAEAQGSIVCWDEAHTAFSSRRWSKYGQGIATDVMMYTRKMKSVQIYCTPSISNLDSRIRQIVEVLVDVRKIGEKGFTVRFTDYQTGQFMHQQFLSMHKAKKVFKLDLYDTYQMVSGFPLPTTEREGVKFFQELEHFHDESRKKKKIPLEKIEWVNKVE